MGGSGSSYSPPPVNRNGSGHDACDLRFQVDLFGPDPSVVQELTVGDRLAVQLITRGESTSVAALTKVTGEVAGTITGVRQLGTLIDCLDDNSYEAEVTAISGSVVTVFIERV